MLLRGASATRNSAGLHAAGSNRPTQPLSGWFEYGSVSSCVSLPPVASSSGTSVQRPAWGEGSCECRGPALQTAPDRL